MKDRAGSLGIIRRKEHKTQFCIPLSPVFTRDCWDGLNFMDEATAFADAENEHQIQLAFERLTQNKTVLMIAHRLSTIQDADLILVFKDGQIAERGTHEELLNLNGIYSSMWKDYQTSIAWKVGKEGEQHD